MKDRQGEKSIKACCHFCRNLVKSVDTLQAELEKIKPSDFGAHTDDELGYANDELPISIT